MIQTKKEHEENFIDIMRAVIYFSIDKLLSKEKEEKLVNTVQLSRTLIIKDMDNIFITHIEQHDTVKLSDNKEAICKICGKKAIDIYKEELKENEKEKQK